MAAFLALALTALALWLVSPPAPAQGGNQLSSQQQSTLEELSPAQREALLRDLGERPDRERPWEDPPDQLEPLPDPDQEREAFRARGHFEAGDTLIIRLRRDAVPELPELPEIEGAEERLEARQAMRSDWDELTPEERDAAEELRRRLEDANPYLLDDHGRADLPTIGRIPLAGLNEPQAALRLEADSRLRGWSIDVTRLPLHPTGVDALRPFGYELFNSGLTTFAPVTDVPIPAGYVLGPGDSVRVQLFGNQNADYTLWVSREGTIQFPQIGPMQVAGRDFDEVRADISERVEEQLIGTRVSATLGEMRSVRVFVLGDVRRPGPYTVSALATMSHALFVSGGIEPRGTLRDVRLMRDGEIVESLDLYDLLLRGDNSRDQRIRDGDVVFVPPVGERVTVSGEVRRPAIYELGREDSAAELVELAGGLESSADPEAVRVERLERGRGIRVVEANLNDADGRAQALRDGDVLRVPESVAHIDQAVTLEGNVERSGDFQWRSGMRLSDLLRSSRDLGPRADLNYVLVRREVVPNSEIEVFSADLQAAWSDPGTGEHDPELQPRDTVYVFDLDLGRRHIIEPLIDELRLQSGRDRPLPVVRVGGQVRAPGEYPLEPGMQVADLIRAAGGLDEAAYMEQAELTRYVVVDGEFRDTELEHVDLALARANDAQANVALQPYDYLNIHEIPQWREQQQIEIRGEVRFPGVYPIAPGETLASVVERAGGFTDFAFTRGAIFTRESLIEREEEQIRTLSQRIEAQLASLSLADPESREALGIGQGLLQQIRGTEATGRLVIDLDRVVNGAPSDDIELRDGDRLLVPERTQEVTVVGEVQSATSHLHDESFDRDDYIARSGGLTARADSRRIYVVRADGQVVSGEGSAWFSRVRGMNIQPGDTIVVPMDVEPVQPLAMWSDVTQVVYNMAIAAAAVNSF